jgi:hypothetical protein
MRNQETDELDALRRALGQPPPPEHIWQEPFDHDPAYLQTLARLRPEERADPRDLWDYADDMRYVEVQKDFLLYALPFCLRAWREDLRGEHSGYGAFVEMFYPALVDGRILDRLLNAEEAAAVSSFMCAAILEEVDEQRGSSFSGISARPYRWVRALTTYGVLFPDMERLWTASWSGNTLGRAIASIQYISCLLYGEQENPVFAPWTRRGGGGPPCPWEFEGHLYTHCWLAPNVAFLRHTLNAARVIEVLRDAASRLVGYPEHETAARILGDAGERRALLESRCRELPQILQEKQDPGILREWSQ